MGFHDVNGRYRETEMAKIPVRFAHLLAGTALAAFADGATPTPGMAVDGNEAEGIRWNNHATPTAVARSILIPADRKPGTTAKLYVRAWKTGATLADAVTFTVGAYNQPDAGLYDADTNYGGATSAMTGDAATKTVQLVYVTLAAADLPTASSGGQVSFTLKPTDGTLGTDDVTVGEVWLEYERVIGALAS